MMSLPGRGGRSTATGQDQFGSWQAWGCILHPFILRPLQDKFCTRNDLMSLRSDGLNVTTSIQTTNVHILKPNFGTVVC